MKKLVLLFLSILSIVIIGCKTDNILGLSKNYEGLGFVLKVNLMEKQLQLILTVH